MLVGQIFLLFLLLHCHRTIKLFLCIHTYLSISVCVYPSLYVYLSGCTPTFPSIHLSLNRTVYRPCKATARKKIRLANPSQRGFVYIRFQGQNTIYLKFTSVGGSGEEPSNVFAHPKPPVRLSIYEYTYLSIYRHFELHHIRSRRACAHATPLLAVDDASQLPRRRGTYSVYGVCACVCMRALGRVREQHHVRDVCYGGADRGHTPFGLHKVILLCFRCYTAGLTGVQPCD